MVACVCVVSAKNGTGWFGSPGPLAWHVLACPFPFVKSAEKQLGAPGSGPVPAAATLWQIPHATARFPEFRCVIDAVEIARIPCQSVGCASAVVWQSVHAVVAPVPPANPRGGVPWHVWQTSRSAFASVPWNEVPPVAGSSHGSPKACGAEPGPPEWHGLAWPRSLVKLEEKQLGADGLGPAPAASTLWQTAQATSRFPDDRWLIATPLIVRLACQSVGWAFAAGWHVEVEHAVGALPPLKSIVPGVPWHPWQ